MKQIRDLKKLYNKYKANGYRLSNSDSKLASDKLFKMLQDEEMWDKALNYVINFPQDIGIMTYVDYYITIDAAKQEKLNHRFVKNEEFLSNVNYKGVDRGIVLIKKLAKENIKTKNLYYILRKICELILNYSGNDITIKTQEEILNIFNLPQEINNLKSKLKVVNEDNKNLKKSIKSYEKDKQDLNKMVKELKNRNQQLEEEIKKYKEKNEKLVTINKRKDTSSLNQFKNKLAGTLKHDYINFKEIEETEMNKDLGEVLRIKMNEVFEMLIRNGIKLAEE